MVDDVLINKVASVERCVHRAREEYARDPSTFTSDLTRQDAAILNIQRACEATLDMGHHLIRRDRLGFPQDSRDVFTLLARAGYIDDRLSDALKRMVGFRNIVVHEYQKLEMPIAIRIIEHGLDDLLSYGKTLLVRDIASPSISPQP